MERTVAIGVQNYDQIIENNYFYIDKTAFIKEWWESGDSVTLITRPRRFGKTLAMSMTEQFFSLKYAGRSDLFEGKNIWQEEKYRGLQGTYPVISLSFANVKGTTYAQTKWAICQLITDLYNSNHFLLEGNLLSEDDKQFFQKINADMPEVVASFSLYKMSDFLSRYYNRKVIILLDEYDTPMQEAYINGYWKEVTAFTRSLFNSTFKTNPWLERAVMTGITRVSKESIFSDLNNLKVVTTTSNEYAASFGFTEEEVFTAMDEYGYTNKDEVKQWYDGFIFGSQKDIYNPWSILNYLDTGKIGTYWANTSSNSLTGKLIQEGSPVIKQSFEQLMNNAHLHVNIDEQIVYNQLDGNANAIWSLFVASGYLKILNYESYSQIPADQEPLYELALTNQEVKLMFKRQVKNWFANAAEEYNLFVRALLSGDTKAMNSYMNRVALRTFSYFDTGNAPSESEPERFYHGFVLGLIVELQDRYVITSNRESGFGRYDVLLEPRKKEDFAYILEFKVHDSEDEKTLGDTVESALAQIDEKDYAATLTARGISSDRIRKFGFAFAGKKVLIG